MCDFQYSPAAKILYTETLDGFTYFWPTTARVGNYTKVPDFEAVEARGWFAGMGYTLVPLEQARAQIRA